MIDDVVYMKPETADSIALDHIRRRATALGVRIEVCSDPGDMPVSVSSYDRKKYAFGKTIAEALEKFRTNPRCI